MLLPAYGVSVYRLRVPESLRNIPTQKFLKYLSQGFARSISQSGNWFSLALVRTGEGPIRWSKFTLPFSLSCRVDFLSSHFCAAFQALMPPSLTSFIVLRNFLDCCNTILKSQQRDLYENSWFNHYRFCL